MKEWPEVMTKSIVSVFHAQVVKYGDRDMMLEKVGGNYQGKSWNKVAAK